MSSLGYQIIYDMVNSREDSYCERVIYPNPKSVETNSSLKDFDIVSFTIQYEQDYFNMLKLLKLNGIPLKREERENKANENKTNNSNDKNKTIKRNKTTKRNKTNDSEYPLIIAGGPCVTSNPLPISDFIDIFILGEAEEVLNNFLDRYNSLENPYDLDAYLDIKGVYIYDKKSEIAIVKDMDNAWHITNPIVVKTNDEEYLPSLGNSILLNVSRGCIRGCRFCMSGYMYRPMRETSLKKLMSVAKEARNNTGINKVSLIGPSVSDYSQIETLTKKLLKEGFKVSTPSIRIESLTKEILINLKESGAKSITLAPESIYSLRKSLNKDISDKKIFEVIENALNLDFNIKFYFLIGIMNETKEDIEELSEYIKYLNNMKNEINPKSKFKFSINPLIPKAHTPFQWTSYNLNDIKSKYKILQKNLKLSNKNNKTNKTQNKNNKKNKISNKTYKISNKITKTDKINDKINIKFDSPRFGLIQYVLSTKGREIGELIEKSIPTVLNNDTLENINKLNLDFNLWKKYLTEHNINENLPWKNINVSVTDRYLKRELKNMENSD
jgi:radical SAM superfamily enzyme YgiQ (UPF0313 family)